MFMEEEIAQATIQVAEKACSLVVEIGMQTAVFLSSATGDAVKGVAGATKDALTQGKTSIAKLSKKRREYTPQA